MDHHCLHLCGLTPGCTQPTPYILTKCVVAHIPPSPHSARKGLAVPDLSLVDVRNPRAEKGSRSRQSTPARPMPHDPKKKNKAVGLPPNKAQRELDQCWRDTESTHRRPCRVAGTTGNDYQHQRKEKKLIAFSSRAHSRPTNCTILLVFPSRKKLY